MSGAFLLNRGGGRPVGAAGEPPGSDRFPFRFQPSSV